ncbi:heparinase II/III family protein [Acidimicrobiaceae bacterium]|nr:heparinase II/III family protein [Acidimicrobiaceae bacterium]
MFNLITILKRIKYQFYNLFNSEKSIPANYKLFERRDTSYQHFINKFCRVSTENEISLDEEIKIFGKSTDQYILSRDIFSNFDFANKKLKPAFFNLADVKVPYEASRLQYLQKANSGTIDVSKFPKIYWDSPMDVAIRNINLVFHFLSIENNSAKAKILGNNKELISSYISQHYEYIKNNLEDSGNVVGNHYLIELTSILLTIATFKFENDFEEFEYFRNKLKSEIKKQFNNDGTSFEGSSHYAAFVTEALIICKLSIHEMDSKSKLLEEIDEIIKANKTFLSLLIVNGDLSQIGDNDSGRLFYFSFDEDEPLKMNWLIDLIDNLYNGDNQDKKIQDKFKQIIDSHIPSFDEVKVVKSKAIPVFTKEYECYSSRDFGIYIWRNDDQYFSIRCGSIGQNGFGGHSHYDQLSIECFSGGKWVARDPGTGTYTDNIDLRNKFKSLAYHWGPQPKMNFPKEDEFDCFKLNHMTNGEVLKFDKNNFVGFADFNGRRIYRKIQINDGVVNIEDFSKDVELEEYNSWGEENNGTKVQFSNGYKRID